MKEPIPNHDVVRQFMKTTKLHRAAAEATIGSLGCHQSQHRILVALEKSERMPISQRELSEKLDITPAAVTVTLKKMEKAGLVERISSDDDSRVKNIFITEKGNELLKTAKLHFDEIDDVMLDGISESEKATLIALFRRMQENLKSICTCSETRKDD